MNLSCVGMESAKWELMQTVCCGVCLSHLQNGAHADTFMVSAYHNIDETLRALLTH